MNQNEKFLYGNSTSSLTVYQEVLLRFACSIANYKDPDLADTIMDLAEQLADAYFKKINIPNE